TRIQQEIFAVNDTPVICIAWRTLSAGKGAKLSVRPFLSGRDYHALHRSNPACRFEAEATPGRVAWQPYPDVPGVVALTNGDYRHDPHWYYNFLYEAERARGLDCVEDLGAPGILSWNLDAGEAALILTTKGGAQSGGRAEPLALLEHFRKSERARRRQFPSKLHA